MGSHCMICGRPLSDPKSVARGIGPICWTDRKRQELLDQRVKLWKRIEDTTNEVPRSNEIDLGELMQLIDEKKPVCICGKPLEGHNLEYYSPHEGGDWIKGVQLKSWVYVHCGNCHYDMALWKIRRELK